jgi:hypothetical protein
MFVTNASAAGSGKLVMTVTGPGSVWAAAGPTKKEPIAQSQYAIAPRRQLFFVISILHGHEQFIGRHLNDRTNGRKMMGRKIDLQLISSPYLSAPHLSARNGIGVALASSFVSQSIERRRIAAVTRAEWRQHGR